MAKFVQRSWGFLLTPEMDLKLGYELALPTDAITFTEELYVTLLQPLEDRLVFQSSELEQVELEMLDEMYMEDGVDGKAKGGIQTLYITDERYIKHAGS